jgi:hypothetical protein
VPDEGSNRSWSSRVIGQVLHEFRIQKGTTDLFLFLPGDLSESPLKKKKKYQKLSSSPSFDNTTEGELLALMKPMDWPGPNTVPEGKTSSLLQFCIHNSFASTPFSQLERILT